MRLINEDDVLEIIERVTNEAVEKKQPKYLIQPRIIAEISGLPTIEAEPVNGWISVKDRLPEYDKTVLIVNEDGYMHTAVRIKGSIARIDEWQIKYGVYFMDNDVWEEDEQGKITHWRNLPEPPKGE